MSSYRESLLKFHEKYYRDVSEGKTRPFLVPQDLAGMLLLFLWLMLIPYHARLPSKTRPVVLTAVVIFSISTLVNCRSLGLGFGFAIGAQSMMTAILATNFMLLHDPRQFSRLVLKRKIDAGDQAQPCIKGIAGANFKATGQNSRKGKSNQEYVIVWQRVPDKFFIRVGWVLDLLISLRGFHWSWTDRNTSYYQQTTLNWAKLPHKAYSVVFNAFTLICSYMCLDCIKMLMIYDPYFWGQIQVEPPRYLPSISRAPVPLQLYRMLITFLAILSAIIYLSAIFHIVAFSLLSSPEYGFFGGGWLYLPPNGSINAIARRGLRGFWGEWWHQLLRRHFCSIGDAVAGFFAFNSPNDYQQATRYMVAFLLSGILHASGSYTSGGSTRPWAAFVSFALQPFGIFIEATAGRYLSLASPQIAASGFWRTIGHLGFTLSWLMLTFPLLIDDLARSGIWFIEPVPFSLLRWMGVSGEKDSWKCWCGSWLTFYDGRSVWKSGFAVHGPG